MQTARHLSIIVFHLPPPGVGLPGPSNVAVHQETSPPSPWLSLRASHLERDVGADQWKSGKHPGRLTSALPPNSQK